MATAPQPMRTRTTVPKNSASGPKLALTDAEGGAGVGSSGVRLDLGLAHGANDAARQTLDPVLRFAGRRLGHQLHDLVGFGIAGHLSQRDQLTDPERVRHDGAPATRRKLPVSGRHRTGGQGAPRPTSDQALFRLAADSLPVRRSA